MLLDFAGEESYHRDAALLQFHALYFPLVPSSPPPPSSTKSKNHGVRETQRRFLAEKHILTSSIFITADREMACSICTLFINDKHLRAHAYLPFTSLYLKPKRGKRPNAREATEGMCRCFIQSLYKPANHKHTTGKRASLCAKNARMLSHT